MARMGELTILQAINMAVEHHAAGRLQDAESIYRKVLEVQPNNGDALNLLGVIASQVGNQTAAADLLARAVASNPNIADYHSNYGLVLTNLRKHDQAVEHLNKALELRPGYPEAAYNLGRALRFLGRLDEAVAAYELALKSKPDYAWALNNLAHCLLDQRKFSDAIPPLRKSIEMRPEEGDFYTNLGAALWALGELEQAVAAHETAVRLKPNDPETHCNLANAIKDQGEIDRAAEIYRHAITLAPHRANLHSDLVYLSHFVKGATAESIFRESRIWNDQHAKPLADQIKPHTNDRNPERRLKIGYISPDLREHAVGRFILPLLASHDRGEFEVHCYSDVYIHDALSDRMRAATDGWHHTTNHSDEEVVEMIRAEGIDILIDLAAHTGRNRMLVFARKPAPIQVTYLAYPGSTGLDTIDYRITDANLDPPDRDEQFYTERSIRLPDTYWCYQPSEKSPEVNPLPAPTHGYITFGCLNAFRKISPDALAAWCRLLREVPESRLMLHANIGSHRRRIADALESQGIDPKRLLMEQYLPMAQYFALYHRVDIALDSFPYTGGTTTCDALWMGVPVVSLAGELAVHRGGLSVLSSAGLPALVADNIDQYIEIAKELAADPAKLADLRAGLRDRLQKSPLMDAPAFAKNMEAAYRRMWREFAESPK